MSHTSRPTTTTTSATSIVSTTSSSAARINGTQACAACKYQRRKCAADCLLAPYFPHDRHRQFLNAHKLFGVSNITKIIRPLDQPHKDEAMRTIIFQSDVRAADPVGGCYRIIRDLSRQIEYSRAELDLVLQQLALCRTLAAAASAQLPPDESPAGEFDGSGPLARYDPNGYPQFQPPPHEDEYFLQEDNHAVPLQDGGGGRAVVAWPVEGNRLQEKGSFIGESEDFKPALIDLGAERLNLEFDHEEETLQHSYEAISRDQKAVLKDEFASFVPNHNENATLGRQFISIGEAQDNDFKDHSALFTLTKCEDDPWTGSL